MTKTHYQYKADHHKPYCPPFPSDAAKTRSRAAVSQYISPEPVHTCTSSLEKQIPTAQT